MKKLLRRRRFLWAILVAALFALVLSGVAMAQSPGASTDTPDITDSLGSWAALVGIALPPLAALVQRDHFPDWVNALIFAAAVVIASIVYGLIRFGDDWTWARWEGNLLAIVVWGIGMYKLYWNPGTQSVVRKARAFPGGKDRPQ